MSRTTTIIKSRIHSTLLIISWGSALFGHFDHNNQMMKTLAILLKYVAVIALLAMLTFLLQISIAKLSPKYFFCSKVGKKILFLVRAEHYKETKLIN
jgi:hypothetical protein